MKTIIAGSRTFTDAAVVVSAIRDANIAITEVVCGGARGVDAIGKGWGEDNHIPVTMFLADWDKHRGQNGAKNPAGMIRNQVMADYAEALIAVWDGVSPGTRAMIDMAEKRGLLVYVHRVDQQTTAAADNEAPTYLAAMR